MFAAAVSQHVAFTRPAARQQTRRQLAGGRAAAPRKLVTRKSSIDVDISGEQHEVVENLAASDDVLHHFTTQYSMTAHKTKTKRLVDVMQTNLVTAGPEESLAEVEGRLKGIEGVPVVDAAGMLVGVLSRKDYKKGGTVVKDVMTAKPIALHTDDKVTKAAHCMIDNKIHRVPVVDDAGKCIGLVTRTDLFWALASDNDRVTWLHDHIDV